jgi:hypothetical protein
MKVRVQVFDRETTIYKTNYIFLIGISLFQQSINDVICGVIFLGTRLYMQAMNPEKMNANSTALVLLNTRNIAGYKSVNEMVEPNPESKWGNQFGFLHVSVPTLSKTESSKPLSFIYKAKDVIQRKRNSAAVFLTGKLLETLRKHRGPEVSTQLIDFY